MPNTGRGSKGQQQKHPTATVGFMTAATLFLSCQSTEEDDGGDQPVQSSFSAPEHLCQLASSIVSAISDGETSGICPDDFKKDSHGAYDNKARVGEEPAFEFTSGLFYKSLEQCLQRTILERLSNQSAKLRVVFTAGTPGSGKSTVLSKLCADTRGILFWDTTQCSKRFRSITLAKLSRYIETILQESNFSKDDIVEFICLNVKAPLETCIERNNLRGERGGHTVPERVIRSMFDQLEKDPPNILDGFDHVIDVDSDEAYQRAIESVFVKNIPSIEGGDRRPHRE